MSGIALGVGPGTGVAAGVGFLHSPLPHIAYRQVMRLAPQSRIFCMRFGGVLDLEGNYRVQEQAWIRHAETNGGRINLIGHSQNALHVARFAATHPGYVDKAIMLAGPFFGALLAERFRGLPCAEDMAPDSKYLKWLREYLASRLIELAIRRQEGVPDQLPTFYFLCAKHDRIVPRWSPFMKLDGVHNICLGDMPKQGASDGIEWLPGHTLLNHFTVIWFGSSLHVMADILASRDLRPAAEYHRRNTDAMPVAA